MYIYTTAQALTRLRLPDTAEGHDALFAFVSAHRVRATYICLDYAIFCAADFECDCEGC